MGRGALEALERLAKEGVGGERDAAAAVLARRAARGAGSASGGARSSAAMGSIGGGSRTMGALPSGAGASSSPVLVGGRFRPDKRRMAQINANLRNFAHENNVGSPIPMGPGKRVRLPGGKPAGSARKPGKGSRPRTGGDGGGGAGVGSGRGATAPGPGEKPSTGDKGTDSALDRLFSYMREKPVRTGMAIGAGAIGMGAMLQGREKRGTSSGSQGMYRY